MFCSRCGARIPDGAAACPNCSAAVNPSNNNQGSNVPPVQPAQPVQPAAAAPAAGGRNRFFNAPGKGGKSFTALFSALTLVPIIFILTIDYIWNYKIDNPATGYIVGALLVVWICSVLPAVKIMPPVVTAIICFASVALYVMYIVKRVSGSMEWFTMFALPLIMLLALFLGLDTSLMSHGVTGFFAGALAAAEGSVFSIIFGVLWDNYHHNGVIQLRTSVIFAALFLTLAVILVAVGYVNRLNQKN